jgi:hypothetical protein
LTQVAFSGHCTTDWREHAAQRPLGAKSASESLSCTGLVEALFVSSQTLIKSWNLRGGGSPVQKTGAL